MEPLGSLFFAGEAAHETQWGTVGGAWTPASARPRQRCARSAR